MPSELRRYTINRGRLDDWVQAWRAGVYPLRLRMGFTVDGAWTIPERNEFVWILSYEGADWEERHRAYYESPERRALDPDPAQWIARAEHWVLTPVLPERVGAAASPGPVSPPPARASAAAPARGRRTPRGRRAARRPRRR